MASAVTHALPPNLPRLRAVLRELVWVSSGFALVTFLLVMLEVFDPSVFFVVQTPRAELVAAGLSVAVFAACATVTPGWLARAPVAAMVLPLLAALLFLGLEATSLVLCPSTLEWSERLQFTVHLGPLTAGAPLAAPDLQTALVACGLTFSFLLSMVTESSEIARARWLRALAVACVVGAVLSVLVPVTGPVLGALPLPATSGSDAAGSVAVPRTGFVCLPAVVAGSSVWLALGQLKRNRLRTPGALALATAVAVGLLEFATGRYSLLALGLAVLLVVATQLASQWFVGRESDAPLPLDRTRAMLTVVFFFSGMAALVYQVVFAKGLALTFGSTSHASTIVLATYMGGLAFGSWVGGRWAARMRNPVVGYALAELGIAAICALAPWTLRAARFAYVALAQGADPSEPWLVGLQLGLGALVLVPPTWLMGLTLPLLTRQFLDAKSGLGGSAGLLYTANTLGAALGASITGYFVLPTLGITRSLSVAVATNVVVACCALVAARFARQSGVTTRSDSSEPMAATEEEAPSDASAPLHTPAAASGTVERRLAVIATVQLTVGGFITFGLETTFVHLLATVAGTSAYAFSLMLFAFLIGLGYGSTLGRKWLPQARDLPQALVLCQLVLAVTLLVASRSWDFLPGYFATFGRWPYTLTFASREFVRFVVCLVVMLPPAICIGAQFPIAMEAVGNGWPNAKIQALGRASALNTVGNIVGALVVGFVALPNLGSHRTLAALTFLCLLLAALPLFGVEGRRRFRLLTLVGAAAVALVLQPPEFDLTRLSSGGNVYFKPQYYGRVVDHAESLDGGLTAVALSHEGSQVPVKTLLTNGKFQGNDRRDSSGEMVAQSSFAIAPLLHNERRSRALVIGFGTGTTTRVLSEAGFQHVAVAELSGDIVSLADRHFSSINQGVVHRPDVHVHVTDGRNFLLLDRHSYDLVSIELSSIWFAGAANLYNDEFYSLVEPRLAEGGVLQQWVQLHRLSHRDIMTILVTLRQRFPRIWMYFLGKQGIVVACKSDCLPSEEAIERLQTAPRLRNTLALFGDGLRGVLRGRILTPEGLDRLIGEYRNETKLGIQQLISTDDNLILEYSTPKGNVREYDESIADNEAFLGRYRSPNPFDATRLQLEAWN